MMLPYFDASDLVRNVLTHLSESRSFICVASGPIATNPGESLRHTIEASTPGDDEIIVTIVVRKKGKS